MYKTKPQKGGQIMRYKIEIKFTADRELSFDELVNLENAINLQIEEPTDYDQNDETYQTSDITYYIQREEI
jgi:adenine specific DNA methylase Mod